jgi:hypothetical protein
MMDAHAATAILVKREQSDARLSRQAATRVGKKRADERVDCKLACGSNALPRAVKAKVLV